MGEGGVCVPYLWEKGVQSMMEGAGENIGRGGYNNIIKIGVWVRGGWGGI